MRDAAQATMTARRRMAELDGVAGDTGSERANRAGRLGIAIPSSITCGSHSTLDGLIDQARPKDG